MAVEQDGRLVAKQLMRLAALIAAGLPEKERRPFWSEICQGAENVVVWGKDDPDSGVE